MEVSRQPGVIVHRHDLEQLGGGEISTLNLLGFLPEGSIFISPYEPDNIPTSLFAVRDHHLFPIMKHFPILSQLPRLSDIIKLRKVLINLDPAYIIFTHPSYYEAYVYSLLPARLKQKTIALWRNIETLGPKEHELRDTNIINILLNNFKAAVRWRTRRIIGNLLHGNFAVSEAIAESLVNIGMPQDKVIVIPQQIGGDFTPYIRVMNNPEKRAQFLKHDEMGVLTVSRISREKGLEWIPQVLDSLSNMAISLEDHEAFKRIKLTLIGPVKTNYDSLYKERLIGKISSLSSSLPQWIQFEYIGPKSQEELKEYYNAYDILLAPSPMEGFGRVIVEAMSCGMIVVGNWNCTASKELLKYSPFHTGILVPTPQSAAQEVFRFTNMREQLAIYQVNSWEWATQNFSLKRARIEFVRALMDMDLIE